MALVPGRVVMPSAGGARSSGQTIDEILARLIPGQTALAGDSARVPRGERRIVACDPLRSAL